MPQSTPKRRRFVKRIVSYSLMTLSVLVLSVVLVLLLLGYRFNRLNGTIQQGGLMQFISRPSGATVTVGSAHLAAKTRTKITVYPGDYTVKMELAGYQPWQKNVTIASSQVLWLNYAHFVPDKPVTKDALPLPKLASMSKSNGKNIALLPSAASPIITVGDISGDQIKTTQVTLPADTYHTAKKHTFSLGDWNTDDRYLLVRHQYDKAVEWLVVDTEQPEKTRHITSQDAAAPAKVLFDPRSNDSVIVRYDDGSVRTVQLSSGAVSPAIIKRTADISLVSQTLLYTSLPDGKKTVTTGYLTLGRQAARTLATYEAAKLPIKIAGGQYFGKTYLATSQDGAVTIVKLSGLPASDSSDPIDSTLVKSVRLPRETAYLRFMGGGRFVVMQQADVQSVYDLELDKQSDVPIAGASRLSSPLTWLDSFHFWSDQNGSMRQYEFDGGNQTDIVTVAPGFEAAYSPNLKYLYTIGKTKDGYQLQQTRMVIS